MSLVRSSPTKNLKHFTCEILISEVYIFVYYSIHLLLSQSLYIYNIILNGMFYDRNIKSIKIYKYLIDYIFH
jgi:hypothetical protein